jgi:hypothetical protein
MNLFTAVAYSLSAIVAKLTAFSVCAQQTFHLGDFPIAVQSLVCHAELLRLIK